MTTAVTPTPPRSAVRLRWMSCALLLLGATGGAFAQAVYLRVDPVASTKKSTGGSSAGYYSSYEKTHARTESIKATIRNMANTANEYTVEWQFYAKDLQTGKLRVHDGGTNTVSLKVGETTSLDLESKPLHSQESGYSGYYSSSRYSTGSKQAGYVVLVKANKRIIAVEASDMDLKRQYLDAMNAAKLQPKTTLPPGPTTTPATDSPTNSPTAPTKAPKKIQPIAPDEQ